MRFAWVVAGRIFFGKIRYGESEGPVARSEVDYNWSVGVKGRPRFPLNSWRRRRSEELSVFWTVPPPTLRDSSRRRRRPFSHSSNVTRCPKAAPVHFSMPLSSELIFHLLFQFSYFFRFG